jgi:hypothetical protein
MENTIVAEAQQAVDEAVARKQRIARLRAELEQLKIGTDPATPDSLAKLTRYLCEAHGELETIPENQRWTPEFKLAEECLEALCAEFSFQSDALAVGKV